MVEFETLEEKEVTLAKGRLLVASKKAIGDDGSETEFVSISKADDRGRFKQTLTIPMDADVVRKLIDELSVVSHTPLSYLCLSYLSIRNNKGVDTVNEKKIRIGDEEFKVLGSMQEIMAEVELKKGEDGLTSKELLERAPFRDIDEVVNTLKFMESKGLVNCGCAHPPKKSAS
jgi:hypothetical protein